MDLGLKQALQAFMGCPTWGIYEAGEDRERNGQPVAVITGSSNGALADRLRSDGDARAALFHRGAAVSRKVLALAVLLALLPAAARAEALVADLTSHLIGITGGFTGASVVLFGAHGIEWQIDRSTVRELVRLPGVSSIQITFDDAIPREAHAMPPGGFRLAIVNCWDLPAGKRVRNRLNALFAASREDIRQAIARAG